MASDLFGPIIGNPMSKPNGLAKIGFGVVFTAFVFASLAVVVAAIRPWTDLAGGFGAAFLSATGALFTLAAGARTLGRSDLALGASSLVAAVCGILVHAYLTSVGDLVGSLGGGSIVAAAVASGLLAVLAVSARESAVDKLVHREPSADD